MTIFSHLSVFVSVILGLAIVHLLGGLSLILDARVKTRVYWVHLAWTINMLFVITLVWTGNFLLSDVRVLSVWHFLNLVVYSMVIYLMSGLLFPVQGSEITDFHEHFYENRKRFFVLGILFIGTDAVDGILEMQATQLPLNPGWVFSLSCFLVIFVTGLWTANEKFHAVSVVYFFLMLVGWLYSLVQAGVLST
jgi:hypothetical protein